MTYISQSLTFESDKIHYTLDGETYEVMMDWEDPLMSASAAYICEGGGDILEIGFGMGIASGYIQQHTINSHTIIENHPDIIPKAQAWAEENPWFGNDKAMTMTSFAFHEDLLSEGFDPTSDEYYSEINNRIRKEFPHKFNEEETQTSQPAQTVAPAKRSAKPGRKTVRLTPSQVAIANKLGVPLEEYAKYVE